MASVVRSLGCDYIMLGHLECQSLYDDMDTNINAKVQLCIEQPNLSIILSVDRREEEHENRLLQPVVDIQNKKGLMGLKPEYLDYIAIAYEPVLAIGTGKVLTNYYKVTHGQKS